MTVLDTITAGGFSAYLYGTGAIDFWLAGKITDNFIHILTNADAADLAKLFEKLRYPGVDLADAALDEDDKTFYFRSADSICNYKPSVPLLDFYLDYKRKVFIDPHGIYSLLKKIRKNIINQGSNKTLDENNYFSELFNENVNFEIEDNRVLTDTALILSKYFSYNSVTEKDIRKIALQLNNFNYSPGQEEQRLFLSELISSPNPGHGFELLKSCGFIKKFWPELDNLGQADHSKEFHPEGNAWEHTMETFRHRKPGALSLLSNKAAINNSQAGAGVFDLRLSLGLLLHDIGKPIATSTGNHRYNGHAELGEIQARRFLERLGFSASFTQDICFLVRNHMLPAALPRLPLFRTEKIMSSSLFPLLMELYRCDESSSFKGLDGYYESSAAYRQFLRNRRNPYRTADGKKFK